MKDKEPNQTLLVNRLENSFTHKRPFHGLQKYCKSKSNIQLFCSETILSFENGGEGAHLSNAAFQWRQTNDQTSILFMILTLTTRIEVLLSGNLPLSREEAIAKGLNHDRIVLELVMKMSRLQVTSQSKFIVQLLVAKVDKMELTCLKALILFNDDNDALSNLAQVI